MRRVSILAIVIAAVGLSSCQPPQYVFVPFVTAGLLYFDVKFPGYWPFKWEKSDAQATYLEVVTSNKILWAIKASEAPKCTQPTANLAYREPAHISFPLKFGQTPRCFETLTAPKLLPRSRDILVRSIGGVTEGSGVFRIEMGKLTGASHDQNLRERAPSQSDWWQPAVDKKSAGERANEIKVNQ